ncbi:unnamed protein product [Didymodactylos carnosus]|uniref:G domain-containing protein n=1 Tax=Didymodactylos carnosus TaxID=1234261 RepID=A0A814MF03_9BILA|nr:unnamed protein product [Didymodactylos carnosus]CAF3843843.1 unnamed protein product [Didymodactylos carnosus]
MVSVEIERRRQFLLQIAQELDITSEATSDEIVELYLQNPRFSAKFLKQIERTGNINRVLVIGQTGVGKSSLINLMAGEHVAPMSDSAVGCTFDFNVYQVEYNEEMYELIDTIGLNEGSKGTVTHKDALKKLVRFIKQNKRGFNCVIFVMAKGRVFDSFEKNYYLFYKSLLKEDIPALLYVGHCENDVPMSAWLNNSTNVEALASFAFAEKICGTTLEGGYFGDQLKILREETRVKMWSAVMAKMLDTPRKVDADLNMFKQVWNSICDFFGFNKKFLTDQFHAFIAYLKSLGVDDETLEEINSELH